MPLLDDIVAGLSESCSPQLRLPEHRQIELSTARKVIPFAPADADSEAPMPLALGACRTFMMLDAFHEARLAGAEGVSYWQRYIDLPRKSLSDKIGAEIYRMLRVVRLLTFHRLGEISMKNGLLDIKGEVAREVLWLRISPAGLKLIESAAFWYMDAVRQPYPDVYIDAMMAEYYADIIGEIKKYSDEKRSLNQFRKPFATFNRHFRLDCASFPLKIGTDALVFEVTELHRNASVYPVDFYLPYGEDLFIVPAEALKDGKITLAELPKWQARSPDGTLPARYRARLGYEVPVKNQPMT
jgi:hypothetical protein